MLWEHEPQASVSTAFSSSLAGGRFFVFRSAHEADLVESFERLVDLY